MDYKKEKSESSIINYIEPSLHEKGKVLYKTNEHFRRLANFMEHPEFREFYEKYFTDWDSIKTIMILIKTYESVEKNSTEQLTPYEKITIVKDIIDNPTIRERICNEMVKLSNPDFSLLHQ